MKNRKKRIILIVSLILFFLSIGNFASAQFSKVGNGWNVESLAEYNLPAGSATDIVETIASWLVGMLAFFGIIGFMASGIMYLISTGNDEMITKAKNYMMYSIVGVLVGLSGYLLIQAIDALLSAEIF